MSRMLIDFTARGVICSAALLGVTLTGCASGGGQSSWPGGEPPSVYAESASATEPTQGGAADGVVVADAGAAIEPAAVTGNTDAPTTVDGRELVSAEELKEIFDPVKTRNITPTFDFGESLVTFEFNSADVTPESIAQIEQIGRYFQDPETYGRTFVFVGHTDAAGDAAYNLELSRKRAETIRMILSERFPDVYPEIHVEGKGEQDLKDPSAERSRVNRRVELREVK